MSVRALNWATAMLLKCDASPHQRLLLVLLAARHNHTTGQCTPSVETLAAASGLSERRVQINMRKLEELGLVKVVKRFAAGLQISNQYNLLGVTKKAGRPGVTGGTPDKEESYYFNTVDADNAANPGQDGDEWSDGGFDA